MNKTLMAPIAAGLLVVICGSAVAATKTDTFDVTANVVGNCFVTATDLDFGDYDGTAALSDTSTITVRCSANHGYTLKLDAGDAGGFSPRKMDNALEYNLYTSLAKSTVWGDGSATTGTVSGVGNGLGMPNATQHTVYGELFNNAANQAVAVGAYSDTITVTVEY
jgi:spore coat protein U-like protein